MRFCNSELPERKCGPVNVPDIPDLIQRQAIIQCLPPQATLHSWRPSSSLRNQASDAENRAVCISRCTELHHPSSIAISVKTVRSSDDKGNLTDNQVVKHGTTETRVKSCTRMTWGCDLKLETDNLHEVSGESAPSRSPESSINARRQFHAGRHGWPARFTYTGCPPCGNR
jgi:hypothetical protein